MRKTLSAAIVSGFAGLAMLAATPASATPSDTSTAPAAVPDCVEAETYRWAESFRVVEMTNNCTDTQRVRPTFNMGPHNPPDCYSLSPGEMDVYMADFFGIPHYLVQFTGLVSC